MGNRILGMSLLTCVLACPVRPECPSETCPAGSSYDNKATAELRSGGDAEIATKPISGKGSASVYGSGSCRYTCRQFCPPGTSYHAIEGKDQSEYKCDPIPNYNQQRNLRQDPPETSWLIERIQSGEQLLSAASACPTSDGPAQQYLAQLKAAFDQWYSETSRLLSERLGQRASQMFAENPRSALGLAGCTMEQGALRNSIEARVTNLRTILSNL